MMRNPSAALLTLPLLLLTAPAAMAQNLYRCANTFSQTPCGKETAPARVLPSPASAAAPAPKGKALCELTVRDMHPSDPDNVRMRTVRDKTVVIQYAGQSIAAVRYEMGINARNSHGAYTGERTYSCFLSEDEHRVLQLSESGQ